MHSSYCIYSCDKVILFYCTYIFHCWFFFFQQHFSNVVYWDSFISGKSLVPSMAVNVGFVSSPSENVVNHRKNDRLSPPLGSRTHTALTTSTALFRSLPLRSISGGRGERSPVSLLFRAICKRLKLFFVTQTISLPALPSPSLPPHGSAFETRVELRYNLRVCLQREPARKNISVSFVCVC